MTRRFVLPLVLALSACAPATPTETATRAIQSNIASTTLPPMKSFGAPKPAPPSRANGDIAADFLTLAFQMESGRDLSVLTRFEGPISLAVTGAPPPSLGADLSRLLYRLRTEAGIPIAATQSPNANIIIVAVPRSDIRRVLPQAACFVAPNVASLAEYRAARRAPRTDWTQLKTRKRLAIFLPNDVSPQEVRDCLHEELAQALGPLNDLYHLPDSVFNDDNVHTVLTGYDMLVLRAYYAPELASGMTRQAVAARLPAILSRINPGGNTGARGSAQSTPLAFAEAIQTALGHGSSGAARRRAGAQAVQIAETNGWQDNRRGFAHYALARVLHATDPDAALQHYRAADHFYAQSGETRLHRAYVAVQLASFAIAQGNGTQALRLISPQLEAAVQSENAALLATLLMLRAEALDLEGRSAEARAVRLDSLGWARYGFGPDWAVRAKLREIATLNPLKPANPS